MIHARRAVLIGYLCVFSMTLPCVDLYGEELSVNMFVDTYVATSQNKISGNERNYLTQPAQNNTLSLNLASASFFYTNNTIRAKFAPQIGDSVSINYNVEPNDSLKYLQEGYVGYYLATDTILDVGVFLSHIGAESWLSKDNINYTRSFIAEFSPYYESGARLMFLVKSFLRRCYCYMGGKTFPMIVIPH